MGLFLSVSFHTMPHTHLLINNRCCMVSNNAYRVSTKIDSREQNVWTGI